jgi:glycerol-3-phosphate dehydrogenase
VVGGKYTTYRLMAEDAVDAALGPGAPPSVTRRTPLLGAADAPAARNRAGALCAAAGLDAAWAQALWDRHGALLTEVLDLVADRPQLARPLAGAPAYLEAEVVHAATHEGALHLDDVLHRRTHAAWEVADRGLEAAARAAELLAETLGWDDDRRAGELAAYRARVAADRRAEGAPDDAAAVAARAA